MTRHFDKSRLPSRYVSVGPERAPQRSYYYAMGIPEEDIAKPFVGLASAGNDSAPCNITLDMQADAARAGVIAGGGRSEEHTSELQSLMRISYAVFCLKKKNTIDYTSYTQHNNNTEYTTQQVRTEIHNHYSIHTSQYYS